MTSVARNTFYLTAASILQKAISFLYFSALAKHFGAHGIGAYTFALGFTSIFSILVDGGLTPVLIREIAKQTTAPFLLIKKIATIKAVLLLGALVLMAATTLFLGSARSIWYLILAAAVVMALDSFNLTAYGILRGLQKLHFESLGVVGAQLITLVGGGLVVIYDLPIWLAILCLSLSAFFNAIFVLVIIKKTRVLQNKPLATQSKILENSELAKQAAPFLLAGIFARGYSYLDSILLGSLATFSATGLFGLANKLIFAFQFIPLALSAALYPAFAALLINSKTAAADLWLRAERYLILVAAFIAAAMIVIAKPLLGFYGPDYLAAENTLIVLAPSLLFSFLSYPVGALLNAAGKQNLQTLAMGLTLVVNVAANLILIPRFGPLGAAISAFLGNFVLFTAGAYFAQKHLFKLPWFQLLKTILHTSLAILVCVLVMVFLRDKMIWPVVGVIGFVVYAAALFIFRIIKSDDLVWLKKMRQPQ